MGEGPERIGVIVAIIVMVIGALADLAINGIGRLGEFSWWFALYGWLAAGAIVGWIVTLFIKKSIA